MTTLRPSARGLAIVFFVVAASRLATAAFSPGLTVATTWMAAPLLVEALLVGGSTPRPRLVARITPAFVCWFVVELALVHLTGVARDATMALGTAGVGVGMASATWPRRSESAYGDGPQGTWIYWVIWGILFIPVLSAGKGAITLLIVLAGTVLAWALPLISSLGTRAYFASFLLLIGSGLLLSVTDGALAATISGLTLTNTGMILVFLDTFAQEQKDALRRRTAEVPDQPGTRPADVATAQG